MPEDKDIREEILEAVRDDSLFQNVTEVVFNKMQAKEAMDKYAKLMILKFSLRPFKPENARTPLVLQIEYFFENT